MKFSNRKTLPSQLVQIKKNKIYVWLLAVNIMNDFGKEELVWYYSRVLIL